VHTAADSITALRSSNAQASSTRQVQQTIQHAKQLTPRPRRAQLAAVHGVIDVWRLVH
jgi:hypothetical protein